MLYELLCSVAERQPDEPAVIWDDGRSMTYAELLAAADMLAQRLFEHGVEATDRVVLLLPNRPAFPVSFFAVARLGAVAVPINPAFQESELGFYFADCRPRVLLTTAELSASCTRLVADLSLDCDVHVSDAGGSAAAVASQAARRQPESTGDVLIQYSSGSTGTPKTIRRTQKNLMLEASSFVSTTGIGRRDRILTVAPLFHAHGFGNCMMAAVGSGAAMVMLESFNRQQVIDRLRELDVTVFPGVPFMFRMLAATQGVDRGDFPELRLVFSAGAPLDESTATAFPEKFGVPLRQLYGSTETGAVAINLGDCGGETWASVGRPLDGVEVRVVDDNGSDCSAGLQGELVVRSPAMTAGYGESARVDNQAFREGCFWTGDVGYRDSDGRIFVTGRKTLFINVSGNKVDPTEIESVLARHPHVGEAVVVGVTDANRRELIKAVVVPDGECAEEELREWCYAHMVDYKVPRIFEFRDEIPKSPLGKILRKYLAEEM
ncbi:MAG: class I adenylate-forming enzyme family protein [Gammaproteobacteria bacterium]